MVLIVFWSYKDSKSLSFPFICTIVAGKKNKSGVNSGKFLTKELPVRLANIMKEFYLLPPSLLSTSSVQVIQGW